jgi:hypothetical protein
MEAPTIGIGRLIREGGRFSVPHHQRDYSWTEDEIEQLFQDVLDALDSDQEEYFIGLMVFMPAGNREFTILDGQQRLATTILILSSIRTWLRARDYIQDADQIQSTYIAARELGSQEYQPLLVLNQNNNRFFERYVVREAPDEDIRLTLDQLKRYDPSRPLLEGILFCRTRIKSIAAPGNNDDSAGARRLFELVRYLEDGVKVVRLNVPSEANAYTVFETLNDRGLDLSVLDLVKNHVFGRMTSTSQLRDTQSRWTQMMANLANVPADDFLKAWWTSRRGRVQTAQLFPRFKHEVTAAQDAVSVSEDMLAASEIYAALEIADDPLWADVSEGARQRVRALRLLGARQVKPVLLSAFERFELRELERLLHLLEVLIVRYQLIGGGRTGRLEISCARLAHRIYQKEVLTAVHARDAIRDIFPSDEDFRMSFLNKQERNNQKVKYILSQLEIQARRAEGKAPLGDELEPLRSLTVEHVFPRSPGSEWSTLLDADPLIQEECTFRLGNICLLTSVNRNLGNRPFSEKKETFKKSNLLLTSRISEAEVWDRSSIEKRQARLAKLAVTHWRFQ